MKNLFLIILTSSVLLATQIVHAQNAEAPRLINLQAVLVDEGGNVLYNQQEADIIFSIVDGAGETFYEEIQHVVLVNGAISVLVGEGKDVSSGAPKGGIPIEALSPDGTKLLRVKLADQSIPQEDLQLASVPYAMYAQQAYGLVEPLDSSGILDGSLEQADLSPALLEFINNSVEGVSAADLLAHKTEAGAHNAETISVENTFINASGTNLAQILVGLDRSIGTRRNEEGVLGDAIDAEELARIADVDTEQTAREAADTTHALTTSGIHGVTGNIVGTTDTQTLTNKILGATTVTGDLSMSNANINITSGNTVDGVDISELSSRIPTLAPGETTLDDRYVNDTGDTMTGDLNMGGNDITNVNLVDGVDVSSLEDRVPDLPLGITLDDIYVNIAGDTMTGTLAATSFTGNGAGITNINAGNVTTGTMSGARIGDINDIPGTLDDGKIAPTIARDSEIPTYDFTGWDTNAADDLTTSNTNFSGWDTDATNDITTTGGTISGGNLNMSGGNIEMSPGATVDGVDISAIDFNVEPTPPAQLAFASGRARAIAGTGGCSGYNIDSGTYLVNEIICRFDNPASSSNYVVVATLDATIGWGCSTGVFLGITNKSAEQFTITARCSGENSFFLPWGADFVVYDY